jgi:hypothetical protein
MTPTSDTRSTSDTNSPPAEPVEPVKKRKLSLGNEGRHETKRRILFFPSDADDGEVNDISYLLVAESIIKPRISKTRLPASAQNILIAAESCRRKKTTTNPTILNFVGGIGSGKKQACERFVKEAQMLSGGLRNTIELPYLILDGNSLTEETNVSEFFQVTPNSKSKRNSIPPLYELLETSLQSWTQKGIHKDDTASLSHHAMDEIEEKENMEEEKQQEEEEKGGVTIKNPPYVFIQVNNAQCVHPSLLRALKLVVSELQVREKGRRDHECEIERSRFCCYPTFVIIYITTLSSFWPNKKKLDSTLPRSDSPNRSSNSGSPRKNQTPTKKSKPMKAARRVSKHPTVEDFDRTILLDTGNVLHNSDYCSCVNSFLKEYQNEHSLQLNDPCWDGLGEFVPFGAPEEISLRDHIKEEICKLTNVESHAITPDPGECEPAYHKYEDFLDPNVESKIGCYLSRRNCTLLVDHVLRGYVRSQTNLGHTYIKHAVQQLLSPMFATAKRHAILWMHEQNKASDKRNESLKYQIKFDLHLSTDAVVDSDSTEELGDGRNDGDCNYDFSSCVHVCRLKKKHSGGNFFSTETFKHPIYKCPLPI